MKGAPSLMGDLVVSVTVTGPDPKVVKSSATPSSCTKDGMTSLSVTGNDQLNENIKPWLISIALC